MTCPPDPLPAQGFESAARLPVDEIRGHAIAGERVGNETGARMTRDATVIGFSKRGASFRLASGDTPLVRILDRLDPSDPSVVSPATSRGQRNILHRQDPEFNSPVVNLVDCARLVETVPTLGLDWWPRTEPLVRVSSESTVGGFGR